MIGCIYIHFIAPLLIYLGRSFPCYVRCLSVTCRFLGFFCFLPLVFAFCLCFFCRFCRVSFSEGFQAVQEAITSNRRRIDPHLLFVVIILYKNTRNQDEQKLLCRTYFAKRSWPLQHERRKKQMRRNCNQQLNLEWGVKTMKGGQKNFPHDDYINGTNFKICQVPD